MCVLKKESISRIVKKVVGSDVLVSFDRGIWCKGKGKWEKGEQVDVCVVSWRVCSVVAEQNAGDGTGRKGENVT